MALAKASRPLGSLLRISGTFALAFGLADCVWSHVARAGPQAPPETGVWIDHTGSGAVEVYVCNDRPDRLCGRIVWLKEPLNQQGVPKRDRYNPNEALQKRPICGLPVLGNLAKVPDGGFDGGWIYDPKGGKSYSAAIQQGQRDRLIVTGYVGMKFLSKSFTWTRAPADLQRCEGAPPAAQEAAAGKAAPPVTPTAAHAVAPAETVTNNKASAESKNDGAKTEGAKNESAASAAHAKATATTAVSAPSKAAATAPAGASAAAPAAAASLGANAESKGAPAVPKAAGATAAGANKPATAAATLPLAVPKPVIATKPASAAAKSVTATAAPATKPPSTAAAKTDKGKTAAAPPATSASPPAGKATATGAASGGATKPSAAAGTKSAKADPATSTDSESSAASAAKSAASDATAAAPDTTRQSASTAPAPKKKAAPVTGFSWEIVTPPGQHDAEAR